MKALPDWSSVYPQGTKEGDDEYNFFMILARDPKYIWRSTTAIANDSGLTPERVEQIIQKYLKIGLVYANPKNDDSWGYWARIPKELLPKEYQTLVEKDHKARMEKHLK